MNWALTEIEKELVNLVKNKYIGNVCFQINIFAGGISNMNITTKKSIKRVEKAPKSFYEPRHTIGMNL